MIVPIIVCEIGFWVVLVLLVAACAVLAMTTWREIGRLFGL